MQIRLTKAAVQKLQEELNQLEGKERPQIAERIKAARSYGDLNENYEYHAAKEAQGMLEARIRELRAVLSRAQIVESSTEAHDVIGLGSKVTALDKELAEEITYIIVTMVDADPMNDKISDQSPIGKALQGKKVGDVVEIQVPAGTHHVEILKIEPSEI